VHEYVSQLTSTLRLNCILQLKSKKFVGQNLLVKIQIFRSKNWLHEWSVSSHWWSSFIFINDNKTEDKFSKF